MTAASADQLQVVANQSPYHLTSEQIEFFDTNGYLILRNWIPADLLKRLQEAGDTWIQEGWQCPSDSPDIQDYHFADRPAGRVMFRVNYVHNKGQSASLELLGSPQVLAVAESLCGRNFVPTYESMVFKEENDGAQIIWHQDAVHPRNYRIFNYDVYLDPSTKDGGALRVLAKTQTHPQDFCQLADQYGWNPPNVVIVEMQPGDVLLHDVMVAHGSPEVEGKARRRTIYYEFRAAEQILSEGPWDQEWVDRRLRLLPLGLAAYQQAFPVSDAFQWAIDDAYRPNFSTNREEELKIVHVVHTSGMYCSAGSVKK
ncbi:MAG: phytanoyl-CoA dioxygenase family protein [Anaerolineae bacterium]|nr:phytanoyl-CoA dioxygenase family protein [Anaerolineae bacterium]